MNQYVPFKSRCPRCGYEWLQDGYTRHTLLELLSSNSSIEAYCMRCGVLWPIAAEEQHALRTELAESPQSPHSSGATGSTPGGNTHKYK